MSRKIRRSYTSETTEAISILSSPMHSARVSASYIAKKDMEKCRSLRTWMRRLHCLFIDRENVKEALKTIPLPESTSKEWEFPCVSSRKAQNKTDDLMLPFKEEVSRLRKRVAVRLSRWRSELRRCVGGLICLVSKKHM